LGYLKLKTDLGSKPVYSNLNIKLDAITMLIA